MVFRLPETVNFRYNLTSFKPKKLATMNSYVIAHIVHLYCAIAFVGGVIFEALILSVLHSSCVSRESRREVEQAISRRAVCVMPWIVGAVFLSGGAMVHRYLDVLKQPFASSFGT